RGGLLTTWHDGLIRAGADWLVEIETAISVARVAVLLVSPDFLNSPFIHRVEIPGLFQRRSVEDLEIVPLIVRPCAWRQVPWLARLQARPRSDKTLLELGKAKAERELAVIAEEISALVQRTLDPVPQAPRLPVGLDSRSISDGPERSAGGPVGVE